jgi:hypothetical protein
VDLEIKEYEILNIKGELVKSNRNALAYSAIDIEYLSQGIYFIKLFSEDFVVKKKFAVIRE